MLSTKTRNALLLLLFFFTNVVLNAQTNPAPKGFAFTLKSSSTTSAGVYTSDGVLIRTLWSGKKLAAGSYTKFWDGKDESGNVVADGQYVYKVLSNNLNAVWEGVIGNTTKNLVGFFDVTHSMAFNSQYGYMAAGYEEQQPVAFKFPIGDKNNVTAIGGKAATTKWVAADDSHVYWGASDANRHWVYSTNVSDDRPYLPAKGISVSVYNTPNCPGAIDVFHDQIGTANSNATITGMAVQKNGPYLFVSHGGLNRLNVLDKLSGALVQSLYVQAPGVVAIDDNDNLWMISNTTTVARYSVNSNGTLSGANLTLAAVGTPVALAAKGNTVLVSDLSTQQVRSFNSGTGAAGPVLGTAGGYANGPEITNTKFYWKDKRFDFYGTFLAFQPDGNFWVGDGGQTNQHYGNCRYLKFSSGFNYLDQIMYIPAFYSCAVDKNNPTRAFANYLEFKVNYNQPARENWQLVHNWGYNVLLNRDDLLTRLKGLQTLSNGRTYAAVGGGMMDMVELQPGFGIRYTGVQYSINSQLYPDGSLYTMNEAKTGQMAKWYKSTLLGFDALNNPKFSPQVVVESTPVVTNQDPVFTGNLSTLTSGEVTKGGVFVSFDGNTPGQNDALGNFKATTNPSFRSTGYHLGGVKGGKWLWKTALITHPEYSGQYPADGTYDIGNGVNQYSGSKALVQDDLIVWGYHGEFWKGGQTNMWNIVFENGLFVNQFGSYAQGQPVDGMAGNSFSASVLKVGEDMFLYTNDESYHSGLHRWKITGLNTIEVQTAQPMPNATVPDEGVDLMEGLPFNAVVNNNTNGWTRTPENEDYTNIFNQYWTVKTSVKTTQKIGNRDLYVKFRKDNGEATVNRDLGNNSGLTSWTISGRLNFDENNGNVLTDGGLFFDILDNTGKIIVRIGDERKHISDGKFDRIIWANNQKIISVPENDLFSTIFTFQDIRIVENGGIVSIKYGDYNPVSSLVFEPGANWQAPKTIRLYFFSKNSNYTRSISVADLRFKKNTENVSTIILPDAQCPGTGSILREQWNNVPGARIANVPVNTVPDSKSYLTSFKVPANMGDNYATRISGYVCVPKTGNYTFYIASDDDGELWLSTDASPANKKRIAYLVGYSSEDQFDKFPTQTSAPIALKAGERYYIEALLKENNGGDHLSVAWRLPDGTLESPIPGSRLIPYDGAKVDAVPIVKIATPANSQVLNSSVISLLADVVDYSRIVSKVEFYANSVKVGESNSAPYSFTWNDMINGNYSIVAKALTIRNDVITSQPVSVTVNAPSLIINPACPGSGSISWNYWLNASGNTVASIPLGRTPDGATTLTSFSTPKYFGDKYGSRVRGYVCVPQSGNYTFYIAADDEAELWLSTDDNPLNKQKIAFVIGWSDPGQYTKLASQKSKTIYLQSGSRYYIEALHKEESGGDHLSVAWTLPNGLMEAPIPGSNLIPYQAIAVPTISIKSPALNDAINTKNVSIETSVVDISNVVSKVEFFAGGTKIGETSSAPYSFTWSNVNAGGYSLTARIITNKGEIITSQAVLFTVVPNSVQEATSSCPNTGTIKWEYWLNTAGSTVSTIPTGKAPDAVTTLTSFAIPVNFGEKYGSRVRGYICVPQTGSYTFYIASDDEGELWLSSDNNPLNRQKIAYVSGWTDAGQYTKYPSQKSQPISLVAGQKYYIEALQKEESGGDHLSVGWSMPNGVTEAPIPGTRLIPFETIIIPPTISLRNPVNNAVINTNTVVIEANTTDPFNLISKVEFFAGATKLGESTAAPYNYTWTAVSNGNYTISARIITKSADIINSQTINISVAANSTACQGAGSITWEYWLNVSGSSVANIPLATAPSGVRSLTSFSSQLYFGENYGSRARGYLCVPQTGDYTFYLATDDDGELWLSTDANPANKKRIAYVSGFTEPGQYNKYATQKSGTIYLVAGQKYYVEALQKEALGADHLSVAWTMPNGVMEAPIAGTRLIPFIADALPPAVTIKSPINSSVITSNSFNIETAVVDASASITKIEFFAGDTKIGEANAAPYNVNWNNVNNGNYTLSARATTNSGQAVTSNSVDVSVNVNKCSGVGSINWEYWLNTPGTSISQVPLNRSADGVMKLSSFASPIFFGDNYGSRARGYICVPKTGDYTFYISSDDDGELWLSTDANPANKQKIAYVAGWTDPAQYSKFASQKSKIINLRAGEKYYIEAIQKEGNGVDHLSVAWTLPDGSMQAPIPGSVLIPFEPTTSAQNKSSQEQQPVMSSRAQVVPDNKTAVPFPELALKTYPNPFVQTLNIECAIPENGNYTVQVFNMQGMLLRTIFSGNLNAGISKFVLDGTKLQNGVYVCRLVSGKRVINKQVTLLR